MDISLASVSGIGAARLKSLRAAGIETVRQLLFYLPRDYRDLTNVRPLDSLYTGEAAAVRVRVIGAVSAVRARNLLITKARVADDSGQMLAIWYNQPYIKQMLVQDEEYLMYGRVEARAGTIQLSCPSIEREVTIRPLYKPMPGLTSGVIEKCIKSALQAAEGQWIETLPESVRRENGLCELNFAMRNVHSPLTRDALATASKRLAFEDGLLYLVGLWLLRGTGDVGVKVNLKIADAQALWARMPFEPTGAQRRVLEEIAGDLSADYPMARMVQGDVGCGKTAIAFCALYLAAKDGWQGVLMAPTEILAQQHYKSAKHIFEAFGMRVGLLTGSMSQKQHREAHECIASGEWQIVIGTHALITPTVKYSRLGLVITDEQHRFGVKQRTALGNKGDSPNVLVMSATPIPRTLSLVLYGDLDLSIVNELPPGRIPVKTRIVPEKKREGMYDFLLSEVRAGRQIYVVCPLVTESEAVDASSAETVYEDLRKGPLSSVSVGLIHGQMNAQDKEAVLSEFYANRLNVLVSTTVIEVGVNVPNASVMVIENAERFGLSQLHQLRGRVGRGADEAWCFLMAEKTEKLKIMTETNDGFVIAQKDMELRGAGEIFGHRQSGQGASPLMAINDAALLGQIHAAARKILKDAANAESRRVIDAAQELLQKKIAEIAMN